MIGSVFGWYWGLAIVAFGMLCVWLGLAVTAPVKQRNEARAQLLDQQRVLRNKQRKVSVADKLATLYVAGSQIRDAIIAKDFSGNAQDLHRVWVEEVSVHFRSNPYELGESKLLLCLAPDYKQTVLPSAASLEYLVRQELNLPEDIYYVAKVLAIQLDNMKKLIGELCE